VWATATELDGWSYGYVIGIELAESYAVQLSEVWDCGVCLCGVIMNAAWLRELGQRGGVRGQHDIDGGQIMSPFSGQLILQ
jgi:hypothetical protein